MFEVKGQNGVFFIREGKPRVGIHSYLEENCDLFRALNKYVHDRRMAELNELRSSDGYGRLLELAGFHVKKVSEEVPYIGCLRVYPITETIQERHEWLNVPYFDMRQVSGVYRILGTQHIFFILNQDIQVRGDEDNQSLGHLVDHLPAMRISADIRTRCYSGKVYI